MGVGEPRPFATSDSTSVMTPWAVRFRRTTAGAPASIASYEGRFWDERLVLDSANQRLAEAQQRIANMERSWFWRVRRPWAILTGR